LELEDSGAQPGLVVVVLLEVRLILFLPAQLEVGRVLLEETEVITLEMVEETVEPPNSLAEVALAGMLAAAATAELIPEATVRQVMVEEAVVPVRVTAVLLL
jgi:hypothetical protein